MLDLLVTNANLTDGKAVDIAVADGRISEVAPGIKGPAHEVIDAAGQLVTAPFVDSHFHMDSTLTCGLPRHNESGTLLEGIMLWDELKPSLTAEAVKERALELCRWSIARGTLAIRSHVDVSDPSLLAVEVLLEVREELRPWLDLQLVAFPQNGYLRQPGAVHNLARALDLGVEVVGGIPHFERSEAQGRESVRLLCELAAARDLPVDMHCDESDDPWSRQVEELAAQTQRLGLHGRVSGSHLTSMHSMDNYYVSKLMALMQEAQLHVIANPLINITLQGRHDTYPKRRGMTRVKELMAAGINVAMGHDCVMDPWYRLGSHDMLDVAHMGLHVGHLTGRGEMLAAFDAVTKNGAAILQLGDYGIEKGNSADFVILQCTDPVEALRLRPVRLYVVRRGKVVAETAPVFSRVAMGETRYDVSFKMP
ncbi:MAG: amidohydrolase family protein [Gammaproteobacteria bacterium]|nr:amidohydrolase family protein [Gammaproteobacteria bacterium]